MPRNLRKALSLVAFIFLLAALFPIQKQIVVRPNYFGVARELTFCWYPITDLPWSGYSGDNYKELPIFRTELDWDSCALELVIIISIGFLYFVWLERPRKLKAPTR
jgi:hypothetical protein